MFNTILLASQIGGTGLVHQLLVLMVIVVVALIIWALGKYMFGAFAAPPIVLKVWDILFVAIGAIVLINFLLGMVNNEWQFIHW
jgi:hypothetical protein